MSADACSCLPEIDGAEEFAGKVCPNNPFEDGRDAEPMAHHYQRFVSHSELIGSALALHDDWQLGLIDPKELRPEEITMLSVARRELEQRQRRVESDYLAHRIIEMLAKAFGSS